MTTTTTTTTTTFMTKNFNKRHNLIGISNESIEVHILVHTYGLNVNKTLKLL